MADTWFLSLPFLSQVCILKMSSDENTGSSEAAQQAYEEIRVFIYNCPHVTFRELEHYVYGQMTPQWKVLMRVEKARMGDAFSEKHWKRAVLSRLVEPGRFSNGGDRVSHPEHI